MSKAGYDTCNSANVTNTKFMINVWLGGAFLRPVVFVTFEYFIKTCQVVGTSHQCIFG